MNIFRIMAMLCILLILAGIAVYIFRFVKRVARNINITAKGKWAKLAVIAVSIIIFWFCINILSVSAIILLHFVFISMAVDVANMIIVKVRSRRGKAVENNRETGDEATDKVVKDSFAYRVWNMTYKLCIIPLIITISLISYGYVNMTDIEETDYIVRTDKSIRNEGYRIALIADLHFGVSLDEAELNEVCEDISEENIDIMVLCGDIVDEGTSYGEMQAVFKAFGKVKTSCGIYYVYGNHDRQYYSSDRSYTVDQLNEAITSNGITILQDEIEVVNGELTIIGREDASRQRKSLEELYENVNKDNYVLVLDHQPNDYEENSNLGTDLALSGHTHAGQIWPANLFLEIIKFNDAVYGKTKINNFTGIVTSGIAGWAYPIKTSAPAEYVIIGICR